MIGFRERFHIPVDADGRPLAYFAGNSLGLQPLETGAEIRRELEDWARLGVEGHFEGRVPWYDYHEALREPLAGVVGARPGEVVAMNSLTVNLHLMMVSFYRPVPSRSAILINVPGFPSDRYAAQSQLRFHGVDPDRGLIEVTGGADAVESALERDGERIALVLLEGVNFLTGELLDIERVTRAAQRHGCTVGIDLAHAAGNVPLALHDWGVDFAVWCSYKYLNAGPGAVGGCFVHERHTSRDDLPRFAGWWGNDPGRRFRMDVERSFEPVPSADGWQLSNPPILAMAPLRASLALFAEAGMDTLRARSIELGRLLDEEVSRHRVERLTPVEAARRGCQLSLRIPERAPQLVETLRSSGVVVDFRPPDVVRVAPVPMYNSNDDVRRFGRALDRWAGIE